MGRIHSLLGGALVAAAGTYYYSEEFQNRKTHVSSVIYNTQDLIDNNLPPQARPARHDTISYTERPIVETCKDLWNESIISGVNTVYSVNWYNIATGMVASVESLFK